MRACFRPQRKRLRRNIVLASILLGLAAPAVQGRQSLEFDLSRLSERGRDAYSRLQTATMFRMGTVGFAGETSSEEQALQNLLYETEAIGALKSLCRSARAAGSLYAFVGLRTRDIKTFEEEVRLYRARSEQKRERSEHLEESPRSSPWIVAELEAGPGTVLTQSGCLVMPQQIESILRRIEMGIYYGGFGNVTTRELSLPK